jgi:energy-coupling factor transporter transmembrane protein EcfT
VVSTTKVVPRREALKRLGFGRELAIYIAFGIVPVVVISLVMLILSWWEGWPFLVFVAFIVAYATIRFSLFLGLSPIEWLLVAVLFLGAYVGSFVFLLYRAHRYSQNPPPPPPLRKAEDDPQYLPRGHSVVLDWSEPHGSGGGS